MPIKKVSPMEIITRQYRVTWKIDVWAKSPKDAARQARKAQEPGTEALFFEVENPKTGYKELFDLLYDKGGK